MKKLIWPCTVQIICRTNHAVLRSVLPYLTNLQHLSLQNCYDLTVSVSESQADIIQPILSCMQLKRLDVSSESVTLSVVRPCLGDMHFVF